MGNGEMLSMVTINDRKLELTWQFENFEPTDIFAWF